MLRVVLDTSVLVAAARSNLGASFAIVHALPSPRFEIALSLGLYLEWQDVLCRSENLPPGQTIDDARRFLRFLASLSHHQRIYFPLRPTLPDPDDELLLELAFASQSRYILTHNTRDFRGSERFGIEAIAPRDFLPIIRAT